MCQQTCQKNGTVKIEAAFQTLQGFGNLVKNQMPFAGSGPQLRTFQLPEGTLKYNDES